MGLSCVVVWWCRAVVHITAAHFLSNRGGRGGAVAVLDGAAARVTDCKFHRNSADRFGGGVFVAEGPKNLGCLWEVLISGPASQNGSENHFKSQNHISVWL